MTHARAATNLAHWKQDICFFIARMRLNMCHDEAWKRTTARLHTQLGEEVYSSWFGRLELDSLSNGAAYISAPTRFLKSWIETHYLEQLRMALDGEIGGVAQVRLTVRALTRPVLALGHDTHAEAAVDRGPEAASARPSETAPEEATNGSPLDRRFGFGSFLVARSNQLAYSVARRVASRPTENPQILGVAFIHGASGLGKTHLLQAAALAALGEGRRVVYLTAERFMHDFVVALKDQRLKYFRNRLRNVDLLIVDNAQRIEGALIQREFGNLLNSLIHGGRQVIIAADRGPSDLEDFPDSVRACISGSLAIQVGPPDETLRMRIVEARVAAARRAFPSFVLSPAIVAFIAKSVETNARDLEDVVDRLFARSKGADVRHCLKSAESAIGEVLRAHDPKHIKIEDIQNLVANGYSMTRAELLSPLKTAKLVKPRQIAMYLSKSLTPSSLPEIGRRFGGRDHTTVLHAVRKIESLVRTDRALSDEIELLKRALARIGLVSVAPATSKSAKRNVVPAHLPRSDQLKTAVSLNQCL
jgi:chromosomal replication initiator protein